MEPRGPFGPGAAAAPPSPRPDVRLDGIGEDPIRTLRAEPGWHPRPAAVRAGRGRPGGCCASRCAAGDHGLAGTRQNIRIEDESPDAMDREAKTGHLSRALGQIRI